ncbi:N-carbamoylputrescine amidase [Nymphaea thermarum]|nr:N-carbamoylputrescine amidase [Nymphaea thermarum]
MAPRAPSCPRYPRPRRTGYRNGPGSYYKELFEGYYFCQAQKKEYFGRAKPYDGHPTIQRMQKLAKELGVVIPVSFFEEANNAHYNSIAVIDADGTDLGLYRKSHIPDGPGYQEKFYFNPGDTGFKVFKTKFASIGVAICWDQWFPEAARAMVLQGAEILFYPTAIGSEPQDDDLDSCNHWKRVMQGHAGANLVPLVASNRIGKEVIETEHGQSQITFYGNSFIAGPTGQLVATANYKDEDVLLRRDKIPETWLGNIQGSASRLVQSTAIIRWAQQRPLSFQSSSYSEQGSRRQLTSTARLFKDIDCINKWMTTVLG